MQVTFHIVSFEIISLVKQSDNTNLRCYISVPGWRQTFPLSPHNLKDDIVAEITTGNNNTASQQFFKSIFKY